MHLLGERSHLQYALEGGDYQESGYAVPPCSKWSRLGKGDLVVLGHYRGTDDNVTSFYQVGKREGYTVVGPGFLVFTGDRLSPAISGRIDSVVAFRLVLSHANFHWGPFDRIIVSGHAGGGAFADKGPSIRFLDGGPLLNAETLDSKTVSAIRAALKPNGVFLFATCGYRDRAPAKWDAGLLECGNKLQRKVSAYPASCWSDTPFGAIGDGGALPVSKLPNEPDLGMRGTLRFREFPLRPGWDLLDVNEQAFLLDLIPHPGIR
jgi:hypothetical protein